MAASRIRARVAAAVLVLGTAGCGYVSGVYGVRMYKQRGDREAVASLLNDRDPETRAEAVAALAEMGECSQRLYAKASDPVAGVRAALARHISRCNNDNAVKVIVSLLADPGGLVRKNAVESAAVNDYCREECLFLVRNRLDDADAFVRLSAAKMLFNRFPKEARDTAIACLSSKNYLVRKEAIGIVALFRNPGDVAYLEEFLKDDDITIRIEAKKAIEEISGRGAREKAKAPVPPATRDLPGGAAEKVSPSRGKIGGETGAADLAQFGFPVRHPPDPNLVAVVIGNREYRSVDIPDVEYAARDARLMREVFRDVFGVPERNIIYLENAKTSDLNKVFGTSGDAKGQLSNWVTPASRVLVYYSGHGAPDTKTGEAYLVTTDSDISYIRLSGYPLRQLYRNVGSLNVRSVTVVLDACFSGLSHSGMIVKSASPIYVNLENPDMREDVDLTVVSSSRSNEISTWYAEEAHGLFTYFFVKGLGEGDADGDGLVSLKEMEDYLLRTVPVYAKRLMNREQTPQISGNRAKPLLAPK